MPTAAARLTLGLLQLLDDLDDGRRRWRRWWCSRSPPGRPGARRPSRRPRRRRSWCRRRRRRWSGVAVPPHRCVRHLCSARSRLSDGWSRAIGGAVDPNARTRYCRSTWPLRPARAASMTILAARRFINPIIGMERSTASAYVTSVVSPPAGVRTYSRRVRQDPALHQRPVHAPVGIPGVGQRVGVGEDARLHREGHLGRPAVALEPRDDLGRAG